MSEESPGVGPVCVDGCVRVEDPQTEDDWLEHYRAERERAASQRILGSIDERPRYGRITVETDYDILKR